MSGSTYTPFFIHNDHHGARRPVAAAARKRPRPGATLRGYLPEVNSSASAEGGRTDYEEQAEHIAEREPVAESVSADMPPGGMRYPAAGHSSTSLRKHRYVRVVGPSGVGTTMAGGLHAETSHLPQHGNFHLSGHVSGDMSDIAAEVEVNVVEEEEQEDATLSTICKATKSSIRFRPHVDSCVQRPHEGVAIEGNRMAGGGRSVTCRRTFDPQRCIDVDEMRRELIAAYDKINQLGQSNMVGQRLKSENHSLRGALAHCENRLHQLEGVVLERNFRLKQLLSENVRLSAKLKRIQSEFGVDAVKEAFNKET